MAKQKLMIEYEQADRDYWNELAAALGWVLYGWTDRREAQFFTGTVPQNTPLEHVSGKMRDDILKAIQTAGEREIKATEKSTPAIGKLPKWEVRHGETCKKNLHRSNSFAYLHSPDDDGPYDVDGVTYCGRCHESIGISET